MGAARSSGRSEAGRSKLGPATILAALSMQELAGGAAWHPDGRVSAWEHGAAMRQPRSLTAAGSASTKYQVSSLGWGKHGAYACVVAGSTGDGSAFFSSGHRRGTPLEVQPSDSQGCPRG